MYAIGTISKWNTFEPDTIGNDPALTQFDTLEQAIAEVEAAIRQWPQLTDHPLTGAAIQDTDSGAIVWRQPSRIMTATIAIGTARREGRAPSHDGEYISIYYRHGDGEIIAEHNGGSFCLDDWNDEDRPEDKQVWAESYAAKSAGIGEPLRRCGSEARAEMIELGWATADEFEGDLYLPSLEY